MCKAALVPSEADRAGVADADAELIDAFVVASRALVGIVARAWPGLARMSPSLSTGPS